MTATDIVGADYDEGGAFIKTAPQIQIPNAVGAYDVYYYLNDGWLDDGTEEGQIIPGWCDDWGTIVDAEIPVATGIWTKGVGSAFKLTFTK